MGSATHTLASRLASAKAAVAGVLRVEIEGAGRSQLELATGERAPDDATPTCIVRAQEIDLQALLDGRMSLDDALITQRLQISGDVAALRPLLARILPPPPAR
jgi:hypothetical protein